LLPITIKKGASIGAGSSIIGGITIGEGAMIGTGSVVTKDVPAGELWFGNPAKFIRKID
jgi:acetyltransferase-like isoleucine patch superfamily enzyme